ncbi:MAG: hypothetical protein IIY70_01455 [Oscillospiraceae bacterium]|nr:hypothetical protein [Oscillospiraceae bacterium]
MILVLCVFVAAMALLSTASFGGASDLSLLAAGAAAGIAVFDLLLGRKGKLFRGISVLLCLGLLVFCYYIPSAPSAYGYYDYLEKSEAYLTAILQEDSEKAETLRTEISGQYGQSDDVQYATALAALARGDLDEVERVLDSFRNRSSMNYYLLKEELIVNRVEDNEEMIRQLRQLYIEAAENNPGWVYALQNAGGLLYDAGEYSRAAYYLTNAIACADDPDAETLYFLGACLMEQGEVETGVYYFNQAVAAGADQEILRSIARYAKQAGIEVKKT